MEVPGTYYPTFDGEAEPVKLAETVVVGDY
jgi:hypothetical protein